MAFLQQVASNHALWAGITAWFTAQLLKVVIYAALEHRWDYGRFFGLGGMPSSHSAVVCALSTAIGMRHGFDSAIFALCFVHACIVMTDAAGVRRAAGQQAAIINRITQEMFESKNGITYETLKEFLGHSPFEVLIGAVLGVLIGMSFSV